MTDLSILSDAELKALINEFGLSDPNRNYNRLQMIDMLNGIPVRTGGIRVTYKGAKVIKQDVKRKDSGCQTCGK